MSKKKKSNNNNNFTNEENGLNYDSLSDTLVFFNTDLTDYGFRNDFELTLRFIYSDDALSHGIVNHLMRRMMEFANEFGLSGNIWQQWLTYLLMMHENPFSLACERHELRQDASMIQLAAADMTTFALFFKMKFAFDFIADYIPAYDITAGIWPGSYIKELADNLAGTEDPESFTKVLMGHYQKYGVGIYGLYRAFRVDDAVSGTSGGSFGRSNGMGYGQSSCADPAIRLVPVTDSRNVSFDDLIGYEEQKEKLKANTEAFVSGRIANNVLLYGDSGTGKSTSVHALMNEYYDRGLRLVELSKQHRHLLPQVLSMIKKRNYRFIIFLDDLSFEENESDYKELKAMLEGALETRSDRVLIYATSNRRHLIKETWTDRNDMEYQNDLHHSDTMEEKLSLASRFGVTIYYSKPDQNDYFNIVHELTAREGLDIDEHELEDLARKWELRHGGRTGRAASQLVTWLQGQSQTNDESDS